MRRPAFSDIHVAEAPTTRRLGAEVATTSAHPSSGFTQDCATRVEPPDLLVAIAHIQSSSTRAFSYRTLADRVDFCIKHQACIHFPSGRTRLADNLPPEHRSTFELGIPLRATTSLRPFCIVSSTTNASITLNSRRLRWHPWLTLYIKGLTRPPCTLAGPALQTTCLPCALSLASRSLRWVPHSRSSG